MAAIVVCGGSVIGSATAMLLARDGHDVTVLEGDPAPVPADPAQAWDAWDRRGVPQFHQPHNLFARARQVCDGELPGLTDALVDAGGFWMDPIAARPPTLEGFEPKPDDHRFRFVNARRPTFEAVFARAAASHEGVTVRRGVRVRDVRTDEGASGVPHVTGVALDDGEVLRADVVIDATGRRTKFPEWLTAAGARPPHVESQDSGFVYFTRFFRGDRPMPMTGPLVPMGSVSVLTLQSDNDTWSVTVFGRSDDAALKPLRDPARFDAVIRACPLHAHWLAGEPLGGVEVMAGVLDRYRRYVVDGVPVATGFVPVGDAWACTNPSAGRGISVGLVHAQCVRDALREGFADADAVVRRADAETEARVEPFYRGQLANDRVRLAEMAAAAAGSPPPELDEVIAAVGVALGRDPEVYRMMMEGLTCLAFPQEVLARPAFRERLAPFLGQRPAPAPGPDRAQLVALAAGET